MIHYLRSVPLTLLHSANGHFFNRKEASSETSINHNSKYESS